MKALVALLFCLLTIASFSQKNERCLKIKPGEWRAVLQLDDQNQLPFGIRVSKEKKQFAFTIINGEEQIRLSDPVYQGDSLILAFPLFNSEIIIHNISKKHLTGNWYNHNKRGNYHIPFEAKYGADDRFPIVSKDNFPEVSGRWEVEFEPGTEGSYPAVGVFSQATNEVFGTFMTETGDYRFLAGTAVGDSVYLSCFDGSHAFLFKSRVVGDSIYGEFFSGKHWSSKWQGRRNESFKLTDPDELTYIDELSEFGFSLKQLDGEAFSFPNHDYEGKVTIIQIMGTWCPNCLDETIYFKELYNKYGHEGLEIIAIGYEVGNSFDEQSASIIRLKEKLDIKYTMLVGGVASKKLASDHFSMLNEVISFPTSIFIGKDGTVRRVHTGFNGPGTGEYYTEYVKSTDSLVKSLLEE